MTRSRSRSRSRSLVSRRLRPRLIATVVGSVLLAGAGTATARSAEVAGGTATPWLHPVDALGPDSLAVLGLRDASGRTGELRSLWQDQLAAGPLGDLVSSIPNIGAVRIGWLGIAAAAQSDPWSAAGALLGDRTAIGLLPPRTGDGDEPTPVAIMFAAGDRAAVVDRLLDSVRSLAGIERGGRIDPEREFAFADSTLIRVSDQLSLGRRGGYLVAATDEAAVRAVLSRLDDADLADLTTGIPATLPAALATRAPGLLAAAGAADIHAGGITVPADAALWAELSPALLAQATAAVPSRLDDPLGAVLASGWVRALTSAERALGWMSWSAGEMRLRVGMPSREGLPATHGAFRTPPETITTLDARRLAGYLGEMAVPRDMASIVQQRESLMSTGASGQMIEFVNGLSAIMGNFDVLDEVFARLGGPMRLIAVNRPSAAAGDAVRPVPELPMFAVVLPLESPSPDLAARLRSGALTAMGIINVERGNQQQPGLIVDTDRVGDVRYVIGRFAAPPAGETPDVSANFAPAIAMIGDRIVLASDEVLLRGLATEPARRTEPAADALHVSGDALRDALARNRETIIAGRMINEGESRDAAESFTDGLLAALAVIRDIGARVTVDDAATRGEMVVRFDLGGDA